MLEAFRHEVIEAERTRTELLKWKLFLVSAVGSIALVFGERFDTVIPPQLLLFCIPFICVYVDALCRHLQLRILAISEFYSRYSHEFSSETFHYLRDYENFCRRIRGETVRGKVAVLEEESSSGKLILNHVDASTISQKKEENNQEKEKGNAIESTKQKKKHSVDIFSLEDWAMGKSTQGLSWLIIVVSIFSSGLTSALIPLFEKQASLDWSEVLKALLYFGFFILSGGLGLHQSAAVDKQFHQKQINLIEMSQRFTEDREKERTTYNESFLSSTTI